MINSFDKISPKVKLYYKGSGRFTSTHGILFSIIAYILGISSFIYFSLDVFEKKNPTVITNQAFMSQNSLHLNDNFFFAFSIVGDYGSVIHNPQKYFKITFDITERNGTSEDVTLFDVVTCDKTERFKKFNESYQIDGYLLNPAENYYCLPDNFTNSLVNTFGDSLFTILILDVTLKNITQEDREKLGSGAVFLNIISSDHYYDSLDYLNPRQFKINSQIFSSTIEMYKFFIISYQNTKFISDDGLVYGNENSDLSYTLQSIVTDTNLMPSNRDLFRMLLTLGKIMLVYQRVYTRIQAVLANIGGILNFIMISALICSKFMEFLIVEKDIQGIIDPKPNLILKEFPLVELRHNSNFGNPTINNFIVENSVIDKVSNLKLFNKKGIHLQSINIDKENKDLKFNDSVFWKIFLCSKKINMIKEKYEKILDVANIIKMKQDIKNLKVLLFSDIQRILLKNTYKIRKAKITIKESELKTLILQERNTDDRITRIIMENLIGS